MSTPIVNLSELDPSANLTVVVGWRSGRKTKLRQLTAGSEVTAAFREVVTTAISELSAREAATWTPDADLSPETYLVIPASDLGSSPELAAEHGERSFDDALRSAERLDVLHPNEIPASDLTLYAFALGDEPGGRTAFLRKSNPRRGLKKGRIFTFLTDSPERIESRIFAFDEY